MVFTYDLNTHPEHKLMVFTYDLNTPTEHKLMVLINL